jgi:hypothetical protein
VGVACSGQHLLLPGALLLLLHRPPTHDPPSWLGWTLPAHLGVTSGTAGVCSTHMHVTSM